MFDIGGITGAGTPGRPASYWNDTLFVVTNHPGWCAWSYLINTNPLTNTDLLIIFEVICSFGLFQLNAGVCVNSYYAGPPELHYPDYRPALGYLARWSKLIPGPVDCLNLSNESIPLTAFGSGGGVNWGAATCNVTSGS